MSGTTCGGCRLRPRGLRPIATAACEGACDGTGPLLAETATGAADDGAALEAAARSDDLRGTAPKLRLVDCVFASRGEEAPMLRRDGAPLSGFARASAGTAGPRGDDARVPARGPPGAGAKLREGPSSSGDIASAAHRGGLCPARGDGDWSLGWSMGCAKGGAEFSSPKFSGSFVGSSRQPSGRTVLSAGAVSWSKTTGRM